MFIFIWRGKKSLNVIFLSLLLWTPPQIIPFTKLMTAKHKTFWGAIIRTGVDVTSLNRMTAQAQKTVFLLPPFCNAFILFSFPILSHPALEPELTRMLWGQFQERFYLVWWYVLFWVGCIYEIKNIFFHYCLFSQSTKQKYEAIFFLPPFCISSFILFLPLWSSN